MPRERGGQGLSTVGLAACYEEMNRSIFGPVAFNSAAPDDGNMMLLNKVAREDQKDKWLQPIIDGRVRSSFVMTEPHPGGGSDPAMIRTTAERRGDRWVVTGRKWFITGAGAASHFRGIDPARQRDLAVGIGSDADLARAECRVLVQRRLDLVREQRVVEHARAGSGGAITPGASGQKCCGTDCSQHTGRGCEGQLREAHRYS